MTEGIGSTITAPGPIRLPSANRHGLLTYEPFYGLKEKPFSLSSDPRFLYKSKTHAPTFDDLLAGIRRREGLTVLTGDIGTGKTTLCRAVVDRLDRTTFSAFVPDPFVSREDLLKMLLIDFGVMSIDDLKSGRLNSASRSDLSYPLYEFLNSLVPLQAFAVVIIDEAQNLSVPLLEEIRILSDLEAPEKLLQVVMVGQLEFQAKLKLPEMRQLDQRVSVRCELGALDRRGVAEYIAYRLRIAGGGQDRVEFSPEAVDLIHQTSGGVPRVINLLCDRTLHRGWIARTFCIDADVVSGAMADLRFSAPAVPEPPPPAASASVPDTAAPLPVPEEEESPGTMVFSERDLLQVAEARPADAAAQADTALFAAPGAAKRPLLEVHRAWNGEISLTRHRWRRQTRRLIALAAMLLMIACGGVGFLYLQRELQQPVQSPLLPAPPPSPPVPLISVPAPAPDAAFSALDLQPAFGPPE